MFPNKAGFTIVEVLIATLIFLIVMVFVSNGILANLKINSDQVKKDQSAKVAEQILEEYRKRTDYGTLSKSPEVNSDVVYQGRTYKTITTFCPETKPATMPCSDSAIYIQVAVLDGTKTINTVETYFAKFGTVTSEE